QLQGKMREGVGYESGNAAPRNLPLPVGEREIARRFGVRLLLVEVVRPRRGRHFGHAAEQAFCRPRAHQDESIGAHEHEGGAAAPESRATTRSAWPWTGLARRSNAMAATAAAV